VIGRQAARVRNVGRRLFSAAESIRDGCDCNPPAFMRNNNVAARRLVIAVKVAMGRGRDGGPVHLLSRSSRLRAGGVEATFRAVVCAPTGVVAL
jgi:hypothetical protein